MKPRPSAGCTPSTPKKSRLTVATLTRAGSAVPATDVTRSLYFAITAKLRLRSRKSSKFGSASRA